MMRFLHFTFPALCALAAASPVDLNDQSLVDRATCSGTHTKQTTMIGNGNPHQNFIFKQISGTTDCTDNPSGSASITTGQSVGWSASIGVMDQFISGGFDVSSSTSTGSTNAFGCATEGGTHTGNLCVFERIQVTAFTAQVNDCYTSDCPGATNDCTPTPEGKGVIFAPNNVQGSCYYNNFQVNLPCGVNGAEHHVNTGPAGGPQFISCEPTYA